jgi:two-component system nitrogen regulation response regulator GlnG
VSNFQPYRIGKPWRPPATHKDSPAVHKSVLIVEDEEAISWSLQRALDREGYATRTAATAEQGLALAKQQTPDAVILDVRLPGMDGLTALARFREQAPDLPVIVITAYGNLDTAVQAVVGGAFDYLLKPFDLASALAAVEQATTRPLPAADAAPAAAVASNDDIIGHSPAIQAVFRRIALAAPRNTCVLLTGESGTGKELVARAIHRHSPRHDRPFLPVHIAGLNPNLVESELFGHVRGAFTGAAEARDGLLTLAEGGTVLLDELGDVPLPIQVKLLRALEQGEVLPVGANRPRTLDLRLLAATHHDLGRLVADGRFREDLFYRLNVFSIHLPPLRERREDIPALAEHFLRRFAPRTLPLAADTLAFLQEQPWPGNVRELRNALEHAAIVAHHSALRPEHFPPVGAPSATGSTADRLAVAVRTWAAECIAAGGETPHDLYGEFLRAAEPALLDEVSRRVRGNRWEAARWLGLNRATVRKKLGEYGLGDAHRKETDD